mmetsp:Transcript_82994/g.240110  ORF Transcript_82994/g.240110 Transcript_82994/m.240110 type:complete len:204 (-) Transcript_82994:597-1208(-)
MPHPGHRLHPAPRPGVEAVAEAALQDLRREHLPTILAEELLDVRVEPTDLPRLLALLAIAHDLAHPLGGQLVLAEALQQLVHPGANHLAHRRLQPTVEDDTSVQRWQADLAVLGQQRLDLLEHLHDLWPRHPQLPHLQGRGGLANGVVQRVPTLLEIRLVVRRNRVEVPAVLRVCLADELPDVCAVLVVVGGEDLLQCVLPIS